MEQTIVNARTNLVIPQAYAALGATSGFNPPKANESVMVVLGLAGAGKSTFAASIPDSLHISFQEHGASSILGGRAPHIVIKGYEEYQKLKRQLLEDARKKTSPFQSITIDTVDEWFENCFCDKIIADFNSKQAGRNARHIGEAGAEGRGYSDAAALLKAEIKDLEEAGYGLLLTGHLIEKTITVQGEKRTVQRTLLPDSAFRVLKVLAYIKAQIQTVTITTEKKMINGKVATITLNPSTYKRSCQLAVISEDSGSEVKKRLPHLKTLIDLPPQDGWSAFEKEYNDAIVKGKEEEATLDTIRSNTIIS
jgi:hypothetical protein